MKLRRHSEQPVAIAVMHAPPVAGQTVPVLLKCLDYGFAQKVGTVSVREADEMKIAQHFSAGISDRQMIESAKRTTEVAAIRRPES